MAKTGINQNALDAIEAFEARLRKAALRKALIAGAALAVIIGIPACYLIVPPHVPDQPADEAQLVQTFTEFKDEYSAANDLAKDGVAERGEERVCGLLANTNPESWTGRVNKLEGGSFPRVQIILGRYARLNASVPKDSPMLDELSNFKVGDEVKFSGVFGRNMMGCPYSARSITGFDDNAINYPTVGIDLTSIEKL